MKVVNVPNKFYKDYYLRRMRDLKSLILAFLKADSSTTQNIALESAFSTQVWLQAGTEWQKRVTGKYVTPRQRRK